MKNISRFVALLLLFSMAFSLVSCSGYNEAVTERINSYLAEKYPGREFAIIDYEKRNETSGRYEINMHCIDDGVEFVIYMSSISATDSYSVERANDMMAELVYDELGKELSEKFTNVTWYNIYGDRITNSRFIEIELKDKFTLGDLKKIHEVKLDVGLSEEEIGEFIYDFIYELCDEPEDFCNIEIAEFVFQVNRVTYRFKTDSQSVLNLGKDGVVYYLITNIAANSSSIREVHLEYLSAAENTENK